MEKFQDYLNNECDIFTDDEVIEEENLFTSHYSENFEEETDVDSLEEESEEQNLFVELNFVHKPEIELTPPIDEEQSCLNRKLTRDYYKGKSFRFLEEWKEDVFYLNDDFFIDFTRLDNALVVCVKSHLSSNENKPIVIKDEWGQPVGLQESEYWRFIFGGLKGERGQQGEQGPQGIQGEKGNPGEKGLTGDTGPQPIPPLRYVDILVNPKIDFIISIFWKTGSLFLKWFLVIENRTTRLECMTLLQDCSILQKQILNLFLVQK